VVDTEKYYSKERLKRTEQFLTDLWQLKKTGRPGYQVEPWVERTEPVGELMRDAGKLLAFQFEDIRVRSEYDDDNFPVIWPYLGVGIIPSAFGCEVVFSETEDPTTKPVVKNPEEVLHMKKPSVNQGLANKVLEQMKELVERMDNGFPIRMHDLQGPLSAASQIWGYEDFFSAMHSYPRHVHALLDMVTDFIIEFVKEQAELTGNLVTIACHPDWIPHNFGIGVSDDFAAVISPELYEEFSVPYNNRISNAFNGIFIHSCGNYEHNFDTILKHKKLRGINLEASDNDIRKVREKFGGKALVCPHAGLHARQKFGNLCNYVKAYLDEFGDVSSLYLVLPTRLYNETTGKYEDDPTLSEALKLLT
jgi:uroporphyrinogen-III decarboxylase